MKATVLAVLLLSAVAFGQSTPPQTPPPGAKAQTGAGATKSQRMPMRGMQGMSAQNMKAMVDHFNTLLAKMKTDAAGVTDPAAQALIQDNIQMWQTLVEHMQAMQQHMGGMGPMGRHGNMGGMKGMMGKPTSPAPTTQNPPPKK